MKTTKDTQAPFTVATTKNISTLVKQAADKPGRSKSMMGAMLIAEALANRHNPEQNITPSANASHG